MRARKHLPADPRVGEIYRNVRTLNKVRVVKIYRQGLQEIVRLQNIETGRFSESALDYWIKYPVRFARVAEGE